MIKKIVVDSNIVFNALLNTNSFIGQILINGLSIYEFYSPEYLKDEILDHADKIKKLSRQTEKEFIETFELIVRRITILNQTIINTSFYRTAYELCKDIDPDDTDFIALNDYVRGRLWTGDRKLSNGLTAKGYDRIINTDELYRDFSKRFAR